MRMRLAIDRHSAPIAFADVDVGGADLFVFFQKMFGQRYRERLDLIAELFFRENVDRVLDRVCRNDLRIVPGGVGRFEIALEQCSDFDLHDRLSIFIAEDLGHAHARLAITMGNELRHCVSRLIDLVR